jgi:hypothetical protein
MYVILFEDGTYLLATNSTMFEIDNTAEKTSCWSAKELFDWFRIGEYLHSIYSPLFLIDGINKKEIFNVVKLRS